MLYLNQMGEFNFVDDGSMPGGDIFILVFVVMYIWLMVLLESFSSLKLHQFAIYIRHSYVFVFVCLVTMEACPEDDDLHFFCVVYMMMYIVHTT